MKCEVCGSEVANSDELKAHMEREHPIDERDENEGLEMPDLMPEEPAAMPGKSSGS